MVEVRRRGWVSGALTVCAFALPASGCSFVLSSGPPANHHELSSFQCSTSNRPPIVDTGGAVFGGLIELALLAIAASPTTFGGVGAPEQRSDEQIRNGYIISGVAALPLVVLPVASAVYGYNRTAACREAYEELNARLLLRENE